jgi:ATP-dependent Lhr-like helicase
LPAWHTWFDELVGENRAGVARYGDRVYWVAAERARAFEQIVPSARFDRTLPDVARPDLTEIDARVALVQGWLSHIGPATSREIGDVLGLGRDAIEEAALRLEASGWALRGSFTGHAPAEGVEWCERRLLARIHRLTLGALRREIAPVTAAEFMRWLSDWQHLSRGAQTVGERGLLDVLRQLQGFEAPASAWESQILARRVARYDPDDLDRLCLTGAVGWGRLSPHPATLDAASTTSARRVVPTSVAPITFFVRDDADWMARPSFAKAPESKRADPTEPAGLSHPARDVLDRLRQSGASFFSDLVRGTGRLKAEVEAALWELTAAGLVTADGFDNLRALVDPRRRAGQGSGRTARPRHSTGRWSLLHPAVDVDRTQTIEAACHMLLRRYGVVFRELLARESVLPPWRDLLIGFRRLEDRGDIRGGRFVNGFIGEQFATPTAVESLRAMRHRPPTGETLTFSAADPLNLVGIIVPGERVAAVAGRTVTLRDGVSVAPMMSSSATAPAPAVPVTAAPVPGFPRA